MPRQYPFAVRHIRSIRSLGAADFRPSMLPVPASPHLVGQFLSVQVQELCHFGAVLTEKDQFAALPVLPSCRINPELARRLAGRPTVIPARLKKAFSERCGRREWIVAEEAEDGRHRPDRWGSPPAFPVQYRRRVDREPLSCLLLG